MKLLELFLWISSTMFIYSACSGAQKSEIATGREGRKSGQCSDNKDNDRNGLFDCNDPGCVEHFVCKSSPTPAEAAPVKSAVSSQGPVEVDLETVADSSQEKQIPTEGWLETRGNRIYHSDGAIFRGRGANIHDTRGCNACVWQKPNVEEVKRRIDALVDDWGANFLRLVLESYDTPLNRTHWKGPLKDPGYLKDVVDIVRYIGTKPGVYALVSLWSHPSHSANGWPTEETIPVWEVLSEALVDQPHVMFGVVNEPKFNYDGAQDAAVWEKMDAVVEAIRKVEAKYGSPAHLIAVQGTRAWGRYLGYYVNHPITAGGGINIVYETHSYLKQKDFAKNWLNPSKTLPVVIGEFGPSNIGGGESMTIEDTIAMMDIAELNDIPWAAWTFHQRCPPGLIEDHVGKGCGVGMPLTPTKWGAVIKARLSAPYKSAP